MIEKPKVGQRVAFRDPLGNWLVGVVARYQSCGFMVRVGEILYWKIAADLYAVSDAAAALRTEAQRLLDAADKLESEEPNAD